VVREIKAHLATQDCDLLESAFLYGVHPDLFAEVADWREVLSRFRANRELFGVAE